MEHVKFLIIGAGPGGLQLGYYLQRAGLDYQILEAGDSPCTFFKSMPRHRMLLSINKVHTGTEDPALNMRYDWNSLLCEESKPLFTQYSERYFPDADDLVRYMCDYAKAFDLKVRCHAKVANVIRSGSGFRVDLADGSAMSCDQLIIATGSAKLRIPDLPGIEYAEKYTTMSIDPKDFTDQRVLIIGKGNTAFETADNLIETTTSIHLVSPENLKLAWKSHHPGHLRAVNNNFLDTYLLKAQNGLLEAVVEKIEKLPNGKLRAHVQFTRAHGAKATYDYDRILLCAGFCVDMTIFDENCRPALVFEDRFPAQTSAWESTNVPGMYFAGALMQARDFKKTQSSFIHGFRFNVRALFNILMMRHAETSWPTDTVTFDAASLGEKMLDRMNRGADLWHQPGFICDMYQISENGAPGLYYEGVPREFLQDGGLGEISDYLTLSLEYGPEAPDFPFDFNRYASADQAHLNPQLHPIVRRYRAGECVAEHHVLEELEGVWKDAIYTEPLLAFLAAEVKRCEAVKV